MLTTHLPQTIRAEDHPWQAFGNCTTTDPDSMFPGAKNPKAIAAAKKVCHGCPVLEVCQRENMDQPYGVWGGLSEAEREQVRTELARRHRQRAA